MAERLVIALLGNGNVLVEGLPGLAKTRSVKHPVIVTSQIEQSSNPDVQQEYDILVRVLYAQPQNISWSGRELWRLIKKHKKEIINPMNQSKPIQVDLQLSTVISSATG